MDYRKITCKASSQYKLIHSDAIEVCEDGLLRSDDWKYIGVAIGSYYGGIGDKFIVTLDTGKTFNIIVVDEKADKDTEGGKGANHDTDGSMIEFVVDTTKLNENVLKSGNMNDLEQFNGNVIKIESVKE